MTVAKESEFTSCWWIRLERDGLVNWYMLNHTSLCFSQLVVGYSKKEFLRRRVSSLRVYKWPLPKTKMQNQFDSNQLLMSTKNLNNHERKCNVTEVGSQRDAWLLTANQRSITWKTVLMSVAIVYKWWSRKYCIVCFNEYTIVIFNNPYRIINCSSFYSTVSSIGLLPVKMGPT